MSGIEFYEALGRTAPLFLERIVFMTGGVFSERVEAFMDRIGNRRFAKPARVDELRDLCNDALRALGPASRHVPDRAESQSR